MVGETGKGEASAAEVRIGVKGRGLEGEAMAASVWLEEVVAGGVKAFDIPARMEAGRGTGG